MTLSEILTNIPNWIKTGIEKNISSTNVRNLFTNISNRIQYQEVGRLNVTKVSGNTAIDLEVGDKATGIVENVHIVNAIYLGGDRNLLASFANVNGPNYTSDNPTENTYATIAAMLADQANQTSGFDQEVTDPSGDPNSGQAPGVYRYLGTTDGDLEDYVRLSDADNGLGKYMKKGGYNGTGQDLKDLIDAVNTPFLGTYTSLANLQAAHPAASEGNYANVDAGVGNDVVRYIWDNDDSEWIAGGAGTSEKLNKYDATGAPTVDNDTTEGYSVGSEWIDITNDNSYKLVDATDGAAVWLQTNGGGTLLDEDDFASNSNTQGATQQSIKAYVDANSGGGGSLSVLNKPANFTLTSTDNTKHVIATGYYNKLVTIPSDASENLPIGFYTDVAWKDEGRTTITLESGVNGEYPSDEELIIKGQNNAVRAVKEGPNKWGFYGALNKSGITPSTNTAAAATPVLRPEDTSQISVYWAQIFKATDLTGIPFNKDWPIIWSTSHSSHAGGVFWGEADDPELTNFVERGTIVSGDQAESPWLIVVPAHKAIGTDRLFLYYHTDGTEAGNNGIQQTRLITATWDGVTELHNLTWTDRGRPLGIVGQENHTGYARVFYRPLFDDFVAYHLTDTTIGNGEWWISLSNDGITFTREAVITPPGGYTYLVTDGVPYMQPFTHNGSSYVVGYDSTNNYKITIFEHDQYLRPITPVFVGQAVKGYNDVQYYYEEGIIHILCKFGADDQGDHYYFRMDLNSSGL